MCSTPTQLGAKRRGLFITFEGGEGCGKSTQIAALKSRLEAKGHAVVQTREPGGTPLGESVRNLLQHDDAGHGMSPETELLLFAASRAQHVRELIAPAIAEDKIVLCDRFMDSTTVYQGVARAIDAKQVDAINQFAVGSTKPDLTFLIDLPPEIGLARVHARSDGQLDRMEREAIEFFEAVRQGYLDLAASEPERFVVLDGSRSIDTMSDEIWEIARHRVDAATTQRLNSCLRHAHSTRPRAASTLTTQPLNHSTRREAPYNFDICPDRTGYGSLKWDKYKGRDILPLWVADMDFTSAPEILDALQARLDHGVFGYTIPHEAPIEAVLNYLDRQHGYSAKASWLNFLPGLVPAINLCCHSFTEPGDSVMTATPVYPPFLSAPDYANRELIKVPLCLNADDRWTLDIEAMEAAIKPHTKIFVLCSPHNPVGRVFTKEELTALTDFCERHDLILISDEIHCDLIFDDEAKHTVTATLGESIAQRTVTLMAPSKTYNLPGLACAYSVIENPKLRAQFQKTIRGIITEVNCFGYAGITAAYDHGEPWRQALLTYLQGNYNLVYKFIQTELPEITFRPMEATYLAWFDVSKLGLKDPVGHFEQHGVGLSDGTPFDGHQHLRLNFGCPRVRLEEGLDLIAKAIRS